jgi:hypothetical protein
VRLLPPTGVGIALSKHGADAWKAGGQELFVDCPSGRTMGVRLVTKVPPAVFFWAFVRITGVVSMGVITPDYRAGLAVGRDRRPQPTALLLPISPRIAVSLQLLRGHGTDARLL